MTDDSVASLMAARLKDYRSLALAVSADPDVVGPAVDVARLFVDVYRSGGRLLVFGNGGSAADAAHLAAELVGRCTRERNPLPAIALADNMAVITAISNDYGYEELFARQIRAHGRAGDLALGLTTSGRSPNVIRGLEEARGLGLRTVALTGAKGGNLPADLVLRVPSSHAGRVQEVHMAWGHMWVEVVDNAMADDD